MLHLGDAAAALGDADEARRHWEYAAAVCEEVGDAEAQAAVDARLADEGRPAATSEPAGAG
jgi:hypothetical protein